MPASLLKLRYHPITSRMQVLATALHWLFGQQRRPAVCHWATARQSSCAQMGSLDTPSVLRFETLASGVSLESEQSGCADAA